MPWGEPRSKLAAMTCLQKKLSTGLDVLPQKPARLLDAAGLQKQASGLRRKQKQQLMKAGSSHRFAVEQPAGKHYMWRMLELRRP